MKTRYDIHALALTDAVLHTPGETTPVLRHAIKEQAAHLSGNSSSLENPVPIELKKYIAKVALHAYKTTDQDIEVLRELGYNDDAIFEITVSIALGAGMARLEQGLLALKGESNAPQKH